MKKNLCILLLCFSLFLCACGKQENEEAVATDIPPEDPVTLCDIGIIVDADIVNVRMEPSLSARILDTALRGTAFRIVDRGTEDETGDRWIEVACYGDTAYIYADYVYEVSWPEDEPVRLAVSKSSDTPVYSKPENGDVLFTVGKYETFIIEEDVHSSGVYKVFDTTHDAYVKIGDVEVKESLISEILMQ